MEALAIDLPSEVRHMLQAIALAGVLGGTPEEVAAYLVTRGLDDMLRSGCVRLECS
jgi:hypothetical protein